VSRSDVAVVGAGPAGAWAACVLARGGARVTLFDPSHPREKPCGGGVTGRALELVEDSIDRAALPRSVIGSARFIDSRRGESAVVRLSGDAHPSLIVASRASFDAALADAAARAGAAPERVRVTGIEVRQDGVQIDTARGAHRADIVIGADGANSLVRRRVAQPFPRRHLSIATGFFAHGPTSAEIVIELVADPAGYLWSFPRPDHLAIGICAEAEAGHTAGALRARAGDWARRTGLADGARLEPYSWPIPTLDARAFRALDVAAPRWALAGDAAGLVDPITREGIYFALASGQWAAEAILADRFPVDYAARVRDEIVPELAHAARWKASFYRASFIGLFMHALRRSEAVRRIMVDIVAGRQSYRALKWRLLQTLEFKLVWQKLISRSW
jgi:menaquinone-9 beta-reductase